MVNVGRQREEGRMARVGHHLLVLPFDFDAFSIRAFNIGVTAFCWNFC